MTPAPEAVLAQSRRAIESGRALFREGLLPESHAHAATALRSLLRAWSLAEDSGSEAAPTAVPATNGDGASADTERALHALERAGYRRIERLRAALAATARLSTEAPASRVEPPDFDASWAELERLSRFTARRFTPPRVRKRRRVRLALVLGVLVLLALVFAARLWGRPRVVASGTLGDEFPIANLSDGIEATEWLLPDGQPGWVEFRYTKPRSVRGVRLLNAHNRYYHDRGSERVRVAAFDREREVAAAEGKFEKISEERAPMTLVLNAEHVTRVRVEVLSFFKMGGGFAEIEIY